jgi:hypothetical protein
VEISKMIFIIRKRYVGEYFNDLRNGYGEMYWRDGSYYKGQWEKGV